MKSIRSIIENTVSISMFNKGLAGKIFEEVKITGAKVVMKNNSAECVLLAPSEYLDLIDRLNTMRAVSVACERLASVKPSQLLTKEEFFSKASLNNDYEIPESGVDFE